MKGGRPEAWQVVDVTRVVSITANLGDTKAADPSGVHHPRAHFAGESAGGCGHPRALLRVAVGTGIDGAEGRPGPRPMLI